MPSRVTIFNHFGSPIAELSVSTTRSWVLNDVGRCQFQIAVFNNPSCTRGILQYGNFVLVEHLPTRDEFGTARGTLPPWVGFITPPQEWDFGVLTVTAYSAENLLAFRPMPYTGINASAGGAFLKIILYANSLGGFQIIPGSIYDDNKRLSVQFRLSGYEEALNLSKISGQDWDVSAVLQSPGRTLGLTANWYSQRGVLVNRLFSEGSVGNMRLPKLYEQGMIANVIYGYNTASSTGTRYSSVKSDANSISDYGMFGVNNNFSADSQAAVDAASINLLNSSSRPKITLDLTALDNGQTFGGLAPGNIWNVSLKSVGFLGSGIGFEGSVRILGMEYNDDINEVSLTTQVLSAGLKRENYA